MQTRVCVGTRAWGMTDADVADLAAPHGEVVDAKVMTDRDTGRSRGCGCVTVDTDNPQALMRALDGQELDGRALTTRWADVSGSGGAVPPRPPAAACLVVTSP